MMKNKNSNKEETQTNKITRKEALKKGGKYAAITAASMLVILSPKESQAESPGSSSPAPPTGW